jgi:serine/threonine protein kinase
VAVYAEKDHLDDSPPGTIIPASMRIPVGTRLGQYEVLGSLGAGGMGEVYRARDTQLQRTVAVKVIAEEAVSPQLARRLENEALAASALNHPNILTVFSFSSQDGVQYLATELVDGETLRARLRRGSLSIQEALETATQIASALDAAHNAGIVHRDLKPENVMLRPDGIVKVLDFGLAKTLPTLAASAQHSTVSVRTVPGTIVGTFGYMPPEQVRGLPVDQRADVWSLGVVLHEMITGVAPFTGQTTSDVIAAVLEREPAPLSHDGGDVPPELRRIVSKALVNDREARYQSVRDLLIDLRRLRQQLDLDAELQRSAHATSDSGKSDPAGSPGKGTSRRAALFIALALLLPAAVLLWKSMLQPAPAPPSAAPASTFEPSLPISDPLPALRLAKAPPASVSVSCSIENAITPLNDRRPSRYAS